MQDRLALLSLTLVFDELCLCDICFTSIEKSNHGHKAQRLHLLQDRKVGNEISASLACL